MDAPERRDAGSLIQSILNSIHDTRQTVNDIPVSKYNFLMLSFYLGELQPVVEDLTREDQQLVNSLPMWTMLNRLVGVSDTIYQFTRQCASRSRIFLLFRVTSLLDKSRELVKSLADGLSDLPDTLPSNVKHRFSDVRRKLGQATFSVEPPHQQMVEDIQEGLSSHHVDEPFATSLLRRIAEVLQVPLSAAAELKLELVRDLENSELSPDDPDQRDLQNLCELLSPAAVLANVRILAVEDRSVAKYGSLQINPSFICPITGQVMEDPVMVGSNAGGGNEAGFTYERAAISEWFDRGHRTCPDTGEVLESLELVPNKALRKAITEFVERATRKQLTMAIDKIRESVVENEVEEAVEIMKSLSETNPNYKRLVASMGGIEPLIGILVKHNRNKMPRVWEKVLKLLWNIASIGDEYRIMMKDHGLIPAIVKHLYRADPDILCLQLLFEISKVEVGRKALVELDKKSLIVVAHAANGDSKELRAVAEKILGNLCHENPQVAITVARYQAFRPLVSMMSPGEPLDIRAEMARAVVNLKLKENQYSALIKAGVIAPLLDLLQNGREGHSERVAAARALQSISGISSNRVALTKAGAIPALVKRMSSTQQDLRVAVVGTLANMASDHQAASEIAAEKVEQEGAVSRLVSMLQLDTPVHEFALKTLECLAKTSRIVRHSIKERQVGPYFFDLLCREDLSPSSRASTLNLVCYLADDREARQCIVLSEEDFNKLLKLLTLPLEMEEHESILGILAGMSKVPTNSTLLLRSDRVLLVLVKHLDIGSIRCQEYAAAALSKLMNPGVATRDRQLFIAKNGAIPHLRKLLRSESVRAKCSAAVVLGLLSKRTPELTESMNLAKKLISWAGIKRYLCKVHAGQCSVRRTMCLIESGAALDLLHMLEAKESRTAEKAVEALSTLIENEANSAKGLDFLVRNQVVHLLIGVLNQSPSLSEKALKMVELIFRDRRYRDERYWRGAQTTLMVIIATGQGEARRAAAQTLEYLGLQRNSTYTS